MVTFSYSFISVVFVCNFNSFVISLHMQNDSEIIKVLNKNENRLLNSINFVIDNEIDLTHLDRSIFAKPDYNITAFRLFNYNINNTRNPEELGTYLEGDILIPLANSRNGLISQTYRWPNNAIPYLIEGSFTLDELNKLRSGFNEYHSKTCIRFIPRTTETDYISIVNGKSGCWSSIGKIGGKQEVNLQTPACLASGSGTFIHELMHVVGFLHEHNRYERDNFIDIKYENIDKKSIENFSKAKQNTISAFGLPYDYHSIMHYSPFAFSTNGQPTIIPKFSANSMGQRIGFSPNDIAKINAMYNCNNQVSSSHNALNNNNNNNSMSISSSFLSLLGLCNFFSCRS